MLDDGTMERTPHNSCTAALLRRSRALRPGGESMEGLLGVRQEPWVGLESPFAGGCKTLAEANEEGGARLRAGAPSAECQRPFVNSRAPARTYSTTCVNTCLPSALRARFSRSKPEVPVSRSG
jgi:hypothetical protein